MTYKYKASGKIGSKIIDSIEGFIESNLPVGDRLTRIALDHAYMFFPEDVDDYWIESLELQDD